MSANSRRHRGKSKTRRNDCYEPTKLDLESDMMANGEHPEYGTIFVFRNATWPIVTVKIVIPKNPLDEGMEIEHTIRQNPDGVAKLANADKATLLDIGMKVLEKAERDGDVEDQRQDRRDVVTEYAMRAIRAKKRPDQVHPMIAVAMIELETLKHSKQA